MSGGVLARVSGLPKGWSTTKGTLHFPIDTPPTPALVRRLVKARLAEIAEKETARAAAKKARR
jgi:uncharacterized protein YdhG (YjbR/CyaY superfamily)